MIALPVIRTDGGFKRTTCACELCSCYCKVMPGYLVPSDLDRLIPPDADPLTWAREHLRASQGAVMFNPFTLETVTIPSLVPAKQANGHCHWLSQDGKCAVHDNSPFGCAFFDQHISDEDAEHRSQYARLQRAETFDQNSLYARIWHALHAEGLVGGGEYALAQQVRRQVERKLQSRQRNKERATRRNARKLQRQRRGK